MTNKDYYQTLGVSLNASDQDIKRAYRRLALEYHPDKNKGSKEAEDKFKEAAEAYSVLGDSEKRARYDTYGHGGMRGSDMFSGFDSAVFADFSDILGDFFGFGDIFGTRSRRRHTSAQRGADLRYDLEVDFEEAVFGMETKLKIPKNVTCSVCGGNGSAPGTSSVTCSTCNGSGQMRFQRGFFSIAKPCATCSGTGKIIAKPCQKCHGQGRVREERKISIGIPQGMDHGQKLRVQGEGEDGLRGGPAGDLYVVLHVREHPYIKRENYDLYCEIPVSFSQAALGDEISIPLLRGEEKITISAGTQNGAHVKLKGKGVPSPTGRGQGDFYIIMKVITPTKLTADQKKLFEDLAKTANQKIRPTDKNFFDRFKDMFV